MYTVAFAAPFYFIDNTKNLFIRMFVRIIITIKNACYEYFNKECVLSNSKPNCPLNAGMNFLSTRLVYGSKSNPTLAEILSKIMIEEHRSRSYNLPQVAASEANTPLTRLYFNSIYYY